MILKNILESHLNTNILSKSQRKILQLNTPLRIYQKKKKQEYTPLVITYYLITLCHYKRARKQGSHIEQNLAIGTLS